MFVHRLTRWFSQRITSLTAHFRAAKLQQPEQQLVLSGSATRAAALGESSGSRWLADAQRMRPRRTADPLPLQPNPSVTPPERVQPPQADTERRHPAASRSRPLQSSVRPTTPPPTPEQATPVSQPAQPTHAVQPVYSASDGELDDMLLRRLRSLRFLVRHGVYNEGFASANVPEQYRASLGLDDVDE